MFTPTMFTRGRISCSHREFLAKPRPWKEDASASVHGDEVRADNNTNTNTKHNTCVYIYIYIYIFSLVIVISAPCLCGRCWAPPIASPWEGRCGRARSGSLSPPGSIDLSRYISRYLCLSLSLYIYIYIYIYIHEHLCIYVFMYRYIGASSARPAWPSP